MENMFHMEAGLCQALLCSIMVMGGPRIYPLYILPTSKYGNMLMVYSIKFYRDSKRCNYYTGLFFQF